MHLALVSWSDNLPDVPFNAHGAGIDVRLVARVLVISAFNWIPTGFTEEYVRRLRAFHRALL